MIFKKLKTKNNSLTVQIFFNLQNHSTFHSEERLVKLARGRECFVGLSILLVYMISRVRSIVRGTTPCRPSTPGPTSAWPTTAPRTSTSSLWTGRSGRVAPGAGTTAAWNPSSLAVRQCWDRTRTHLAEDSRFQFYKAADYINFAKSLLLLRWNSSYHHRSTGYLST